jgi:pimeloyl-ACP methyl ester carboxylesterase
MTRRSHDPPPFLDGHGQVVPGSVSEKSWVEINGVRQGMVIRGRSVTNPVLLIIHGGPGMPDYFLTHARPVDLEDLVTVVWWDQRGAGLSYHREIPPASMTLAQLVDDTLAVADHLRARFAQDRILLLGHSWGSLVGIRAAARSPGRFTAYLGMAQLVDQRRSEKLAYDHMLAEYRRRGDRRMVRALEAAPVTIEEGPPRRYLTRVRDQAMHRLGVGTTHDMDSVITGIVVPSLRFPGYTPREKWNLWRGRAFSRSFRLWEDEVMQTDLIHQVPRLELPTYFLQGVHDYTCVTSLAQEYLEVLEAPTKRLYLFEHSAHTPLLEEPARARRILRDDILPHAGPGST